MWKRKNNNSNAQMLVLMGVVLSLSIFILSSLAVEITDLDIIISNEKAMSLLPEMNRVKKSFGPSLNYNLVNDVVNISNTTYYFGNFDNIHDAFNKTRDEYYILELRHDIVFNAELNRYTFYNKEDNYYIYNVNVNLSLDNGETYFEENIEYIITCNPDIYY